MALKTDVSDVYKEIYYYKTLLDIMFLTQRSSPQIDKSKKSFQNFSLIYVSSLFRCTIYNHSTGV